MLCYALLRCATPCLMPAPFMLCYVVLCYVMLCYVMLCYVMLYDAMLCYAMLCYAMLCYAMLCYAMLRCSTPCFTIAPSCYVMLCYVTLRYVMLCYVHCVDCRLYGGASGTRRATARGRIGERRNTGPTARGRLGERQRATARGRLGGATAGAAQYAYGSKSGAEQIPVVQGGEVV